MPSWMTNNGGVSLYEGALHVIQPDTTFAGALQFRARTAQEAFAPYDPEHAQEYLPVEKYVEILAALKPKFIHHPRCKELIRGMLS